MVFLAQTIEFCWILAAEGCPVGSTCRRSAAQGSCAIAATPTACKYRHPPSQQARCAVSASLLAHCKASSSPPERPLGCNSHGANPPFVAEHSFLCRHTQVKVGQRESFIRPAHTTRTTHTHTHTHTHTAHTHTHKTHTHTSGAALLGGHRGRPGALQPGRLRPGHARRRPGPLTVRVVRPSHPSESSASSV